MWVAVGSGTNSIAYSNNGTTWTGLGHTIFSAQGFNVKWTGTLWVAVGSGTTHTIAYSNNGTTWTGVTGSTSIFGNYGRGVEWNNIKTSISANGNISIGGPGTINVLATQAASGNYVAVTDPVAAGTINVVGAPTITPTPIQTIIYGQVPTVTVTPTSDSPGAFTYSLQPGFQGCSTVNANTGVVTIGGRGTITVLVTQAESGNFTAITTPVVAGTIIVDMDPSPCFKENTKILTVDGYRPIQDLRKGDLVKTLNHEYVAIKMISSRVFYNKKDNTFYDKIYKCTSENYREIFEDLYITGLHAILVDELVGDQLIQIKSVYDDNELMTDSKYRAPVCFDNRAIPYEEETQVVIYHLALDHEDENLNYGIYANGLLVESASIRLMKESGLIMIE
jgi:hypothetical protein